MIVGGILSNAAVYVGLGAVLASALVGILFRGAASAWRDEARAAHDRSDRLEANLREQQHMVDDLKAEVARLLRLTNVQEIADRNTEEHKQITSILGELEKSVRAQTVAIEFMARHVFPTDMPPLTARAAA